MSLDKDLAFLCKLSYSGQWMIASSMDYDAVYEIENKDTDTQVYVCINDKNQEVHVVFRGSESIQDFIQDVKIRSRSFMGYKAHRGFVEAIESVIQELADLIIPLASTYKIYATGHSLGGALALLFALSSPVSVSKVVTFGQPKTISDKAAKSLLRATEYVRYVNHSDIVPKVPFKWMCPYRHFGELMYINKGGDLVSNPHYLYRFWDGFGSFHKRLEDHAMDDYLRYLK